MPSAMDEAYSTTPSIGRRVVAYASYPVVLLGTVLAGWALLSSGAPLFIGTGLVLLVCGIVVHLIERVSPFSQRWTMGLSDARLDLTHTLVAALMVAPVLKATVLAAIAYGGAYLSSRYGFDLWPTGLPIGVQLMLAVLIADLGAYGIHRWMHLSPFGWRLHVLHHSTEKLHVVVAGRAHPFNAALTLTAEALVLILLGVPPIVYALVTIYKGANGFLQHSNADLRPGFLSYFLATNDVHRWHHSLDLDESNTNFGNTTMIWDRIFGTFYLPEKAPSDQVGVADLNIPGSYWAHLATPFVLPDYET